MSKGGRQKLFSGHVQICVFVVRTTIEIKGVYIIFRIQVSRRGGLPKPICLYQNCPFQSIPVRLVYVLKKR